MIMRRRGVILKAILVVPFLYFIVCIAFVSKSSEKEGGGGVEVPDPPAELVKGPEEELTGNALGVGDSSAVEAKMVNIHPKKEKIVHPGEDKVSIEYISIKS